MPNSKKPSIINKQTLMPLGLVFTFIVGVIWINNRFISMEYKLDALIQEQADRWTKTDMKLYSLELQLSNPDLIVPPVKRSPNTLLR